MSIESEMAHRNSRNLKRVKFGFARFTLYMYANDVASVRDALVIAYSQNIIDDVEFALLYDANMSKPVFPLSNFERFNIDNWADD